LAGAGDAVLDRIQYNRGTSYLREGLIEEALADLDQVLERNPQHAGATRNREIAQRLQELAQEQQQNGEQNGEQEQASEELLRRIADDPAGLLRQKIFLNHRIEYPEVEDAVRDW